MNRSGAPIDSSSLIYLAKAGSLAPACECVGGLLIPPAVWREVVGERRGAIEVELIRSAESQGLLTRVTLAAVQRKQAASIATHHRLGFGEAEVLALGKSHELVIIDEHRGTRRAQTMGLVAASALSLSVLCADREVLDEVGALAMLHAIAQYSNPGDKEIQRVARAIRECLS